jgi:hypothetical protein
VTGLSPARTARAGLFAVAAVGLVLALRARSDGPRPGVLLLLAATALITVLVRPLTGRERRLPSLVLALVGVQLVLRAAFLLASTGQLVHAGPTGLFCSPASSGAATLSCLPTERGGWLLLAVQLLAAVLLAGWLRDVEGVTWSLARLFGRGIERFTTGMASVWAALAALAAASWAAVAAAITSPVAMRLQQPISAARPWRLILFARSIGRRGPPAITRTERPTRSDLWTGRPAARVSSRFVSNSAAVPLA